MAVPTSLLLAACADPVLLPEPTGDLPIGRTTHRWVDPSRAEVLGDGGQREVTVNVWYPADPGDDPTPAEYVPDLRDLKPVIDHRTKRVWGRVVIHAVAEAPVAAAPDRFPVLVFSHGNDMIGAQYSALIEDLVSHGFVVAAIDHPYDGRAVLLADEEPVGFLESAWPPLPPPADDGAPDPDSDYARLYRERVDVRSADTSFVLDRLVDDPSALRDRLDLDRVGFFGHSVGGVTAGRWCQADPRAVACANLDGDSGTGPFYLDENGAAFEAPYLMLTKPFEVPDSQLSEWGLTREEWTANLEAQRDLYFGSVGSGSWRVEVDGATHESFTDEPFVFSTLDHDDPAAHEERMRLVRLYLLAFFEQSLSGVPSALFDVPEPGVAIDRWPG